MVANAMVGAYTAANTASSFLKRSHEEKERFDIEFNKSMTFEETWGESFHHKDIKMNST